MGCCLATTSLDNARSPNNSKLPNTKQSLQKLHHEMMDANECIALVSLMHQIHAVLRLYYSQVPLAAKSLSKDQRYMMNRMRLATGSLPALLSEKQSLLDLFVHTFEQEPVSFCEFLNERKIDLLGDWRYLTY